MKAWLVNEKDSECATVVFAETRGKAKSYAMYTDACEDADFCNIEVRRKPQLDKYYKEGKTEMDWYNANDRIVLVKELGFHCITDDIIVDMNELCSNCSAAQYCDRYKMKCYICGIDIDKAGMDNLSPIYGCPVCEACAEDMTKHDWEVLRKEFEDNNEDE